MNITEFAEQIVFGKTLEEKLAAPGRLSLDPNRKQRKSIGPIAAPGRPYGLEMRTSGHVGTVSYTHLTLPTIYSV